MAPLSVRQTNWYIDGPTLRKDYLYQGIAGDDQEHRLRIDIDQSPNVFGGSNQHIFIIINPHFWPGTEDGFLIAQLRLDDEPLEAPFVTVQSGTAEDGSMMLSPTKPDEARAMFDVIAKGEHMRLLLLDGEELLAQFPIPNDERFHDVARQYFGQSQPQEAQPSPTGFLRRFFG